MRAVLCRSFDGIDAVTVENIAPDKPGPGEVRVRAAAVGVNFADSLVAAGQYQTRPDFPFSPGFECAGHIDALGPGVEGFEIGERVMAVMDYGAWREQVCVPAVHVYRLPESMDFVTAAGFPVTYGTSHIGLDHRGGLKAGETLLVHGAAGGVGLTAVEIGKAMGATVIATAGGPEKVAVALEHGADHGIDYRSEDIRVRVRDLTEGRGADVIYDPVGGDVFDVSMRCIAWGGRLLVVGFAAGRIPQAPANLLLVKNIAAIGVYWSSHREREPERLQQSFVDLFRLYEAGALKPRIAETWPLEGAAEALRRLLSRKVAGKIVLTTGETAS
ncbi:MAG: NADPH:quinone oxidoreductase family protein [Alphaproteobacteria bacterium]|nr:NADPH:quinone oxidoreductase family protein [Alphaproteobacteria bacterium]